MGTPRQQRVAAVILLSTLGMCALFLAQGATNLAGTALIDRSPVLGGTERDQLAVADGTPAVDRRGAVNHEKVKLMLVGPPPEIVDAGMPDGSMEERSPSTARATPSRAARAPRCSPRPS
jgi:hypothetical protein